MSEPELPPSKIWSSTSEQGGMGLIKASGTKCLRPKTSEVPTWPRPPCDFDREWSCKRARDQGFYDPAHSMACPPRARDLILAYPIIFLIQLDGLPAEKRSRDTKCHSHVGHIHTPLSAHIPACDRIEVQRNFHNFTLPCILRSNTPRHACAAVSLNLRGIRRVSMVIELRLPAPVPSSTVCFVPLWSAFSEV